MMRFTSNDSQLPARRRFLCDEHPYMLLESEFDPKERFIRATSIISKALLTQNRQLSLYRLDQKSSEDDWGGPF